MCSPRSTLRPDDLTYAVHTPAFCTESLDSEGWILCQFRQPILLERFGDFTNKVFKGQLKDPYLEQIREKLKLPRA